MKPQRTANANNIKRLYLIRVLRKEIVSTRKRLALHENQVAIEENAKEYELHLKMSFKERNVLRSLEYRVAELLSSAEIEDICREEEKAKIKQEKEEKLLNLQRTRDRALATIRERELYLYSTLGGKEDKKGELQKDVRALQSERRAIEKEYEKSKAALEVEAYRSQEL